MNVVLIIGLVVLLLGIGLYVTFLILQKRYSAEELTKKLFKKEIANAGARIDIISVVLLAVIMVGLVMILVVAFASK